MAASTTPQTSPRSRAWLAVALAVVGPLAFIGPTVLLGRPWYRDDAALFVYPMYAALSAALKQGHLLLWDPSQWCGLPALAAGQTGQLYPPHLLLFTVLPWLTALHFAYWLHLALALLGTAWVARNLGLSWRAAAVGAVLYTFSGYTAAHLVHYNFVTGVAHLPLLLAVLQTALRRNTWRWWGLLALEGALAFLCTHPQVFAMGLMVGVLWLAAGGWWREGSWRSRVPGLVAAAVVGGLLIMPQLLPTAELARLTREVQTPGSDGQLSHLTSYPFRLLDWVRVLLPDLFGTADSNVIGGGPAFHETCAFVGGGGLLLLLLGLVAGRKRRGYAFAVAVLLVGLALIPAGNPLYKLIAAVPGLGAFRAMGRWAVLPLFATGLLAAMAVQYVGSLTGASRRAGRLIAGAFTGIVLFALFALWMTFGAESGSLTFPGHPRAAIPVTTMASAIYNAVIGWEPLLVAAGLILVAVLVLCLREGQAMSRLAVCGLLLGLALPLWHFWRVTNPTTQAAYYLHMPCSNDPITPPPVYSGRTFYVPAELTGEVPPPLPESLDGRRDRAVPAIGTLWGQWYANGYKQGLVTPSALRWWEDAQRYTVQSLTGEATTTAETVARVGTPEERMRRFHQLAGVQTVLTTARVKSEWLTVPPFPFPNTYLWRYPALRAWTVTRALTIADPQQQLEAVKQRGFEPYREAVVDGPVPGLKPPELVPAPTDHPIPPVAPARALNGGFPEAEPVVPVAKAPHARLLVLSDAWYPGWEAELNGQKLPVMRANFLNRAVLLPAGAEGYLTFSYRPRPWRQGLQLMAVGLVFLLMMLCWPTRRGGRHDL